MLCQECSKKSLCSCLCPEAEIYANQEEVIQKEYPIGLPQFGKFRYPTSVHLTPREKEIVNLLQKGMKFREVAKTLKIKRESLSVMVSRIRKKC